MAKGNWLSGLGPDLAKEILQEVDEQIGGRQIGDLSTKPLQSVREHLIATYGLGDEEAGGRNATILETSDPDIPASLRSPMDHV